MYKDLIYKVENGIATIQLNRPDYYNALNNSLKVELYKSLKQAEENNSVKVIVMSGAGKAFCSGQDLKEAMGELQGTSYTEQIREYYNPLILAMRNCPKPIICKLHGLAVGAGCSLVLACDMIIAAEDSELAELFIGIGLVMDSGSGYYLPRIVGPHKAFELATMGTKISAKEAQNLGMVNHVVPTEELEATIKKFTDYYVKAPTKTIGIMKKMLNKSLHMTLEEMLEYEAMLQQLAGSTADHKEGVTAFLEKRQPNFTGK